MSGFLWLFKLLFNHPHLMGLSCFNSLWWLMTMASQSRERYSRFTGMKSSILIKTSPCHYWDIVSCFNLGINYVLLKKASSVSRGVWGIIARHRRRRLSSPLIGQLSVIPASDWSMTGPETRISGGTSQSSAGLAPSLATASQNGSNWVKRVRRLTNWGKFAWILLKSSW